VGDFDRAYGLDVAANPLFSGADVQRR
jgi:hypothetical protein